MQTVSPKLQIYINIAALVLTGLIGAAAQWTDLFGPDVAKKIVSGLGLVGIIIAAVNVGLSGYSSPKAGPFVGGGSQINSVWLVGAIVLALALAMLRPGMASAQVLKPKASNNPINLLATWADGDLKAAIAASTQFSGLQDQVGAACWGQIQTLASIVKAHPLPATLHLATDIEYARLTQAALNELCRNPSCAQVWADAANIVQSFSVAPLPISFSLLCGRVPVVGLAIPTTASPVSK